MPAALTASKELLDSNCALNLVWRPILEVWKQAVPAFPQRVFASAWRQWLLFLFQGSLLPGLQEWLFRSSYGQPIAYPERSLPFQAIALRSGFRQSYQGRKKPTLGFGAQTMPKPQVPIKLRRRSTTRKCPGGVFCRQPTAAPTAPRARRYPICCGNRPNCLLVYCQSSAHSYLYFFPFCNHALQ